MSLSACEDLQRAWEGPRGSLTAVLCRFLSQYIFLEYDLLRAMGRSLTSMTETNAYPSYRALMAHVKYATIPVLIPPSIRLSAYSIALSALFSIQLHTNCRELHKYTLAEKKKAAQGRGVGFDGEMNNFQAPQLSSLSKLVSGFFIFILPAADLLLMGAVMRIWMPPFTCDSRLLRFSFHLRSVYRIYVIWISSCSPLCLSYSHLRD